MTDVILDAPSDSFENSNDGESGSTLVMLKSIYYLMQNSPNNVSFLNGSNLGLSSFKIDSCKQAYRYDNSKVLTGTLLDDNSTPPYLGSQTIEANGVKQKIVTVKYSKKKTLRPLHGTMKLTWWTGYLWSNQTCSVTDDGDFWVSECDHLTDFTLIVDGLQKDPCLCNNGLIAIMAIISYWLLISCITMTIFQAWKILKAFSWSSVSEKLMIWLTNKILIIVTAIGIPTLMALISGLVVKDFYNREDGFCWIRPDYVIFGVILPLTLLVANGIFCFVVALLRLFPKICGIALIRTASSTIGKRPKKKEKLVALIIMQFILGIPWILQYLTLFTSYATVWHYLFTIVNGSQGIILLFIYLYKSYKHYTHQKYKVNRELEISNAKIETETPSSHIKRIRSFTTETNVVNGMSPRVPKHKNEGMNLEVPQVKYENMKNLEFDNNNF
uniref:G-protein coupled receptors family 2 profile 2 domain-containing protein n=1 Tax=Acrobeloides nanus TaxID=290746 RepID=A0A914C1K5_9BILA